MVKPKDAKTVAAAWWSLCIAYSSFFEQDREYSQWEELDSETKTCTLQLINWAMSCPEIHISTYYESWVTCMSRAGWIPGPHFDEIGKTSPDMLSFSRASKHHQIKLNILKVMIRGFYA